MSEKEIQELMVTIFLGYKYRKQHDMLYSQDAKVPMSLIKLYYSDIMNRLDVNSVSQNFIGRYIKNESFVEEVHDEEEIKGLGVMYDTMQNMTEDEFELFSLPALHRALYSKCEFNEFGGKLRTSSAYLKGCQVDLSEPGDILMDLINVEDVFNSLKSFAIAMRESNDYSQIRPFIRECIKLKCRLIKIHPFADGNGRTIRCFINKLFELASIPPVYISKNEKDEYKDAMNEALRYRSCGEIDDDSKYEKIANFYLYKICDSIIELDINKRVQKEKGEGVYEKHKISSKK